MRKKKQINKKQLKTLKLIEKPIRELHHIDKDSIKHTRSNINA